MPKQRVPKRRNAMAAALRFFRVQKVRPRKGRGLTAVRLPGPTKGLYLKFTTGRSIVARRQQYALYDINSIGLWVQLAMVLALLVKLIWF